MTTPTSALSFTLNGELVKLNNVSPNLSLNDWLRAQHGLSGTKKMCAEGGCGCCVVTASRTDLLTKKPTTFAINSCLCPLYSINGWTITTIEGIGSSRKGFHPVQSKIADYNATQCGYCTPGFVMSMYSLLEENPKPTKQIVEDNFDGHICRCTGYRSILDAAKSFAVDSDEPEIIDMEDFNPTQRMCSTCPRLQWVALPRNVGDPIWYHPTKLSDIFDIYHTNTNSIIKLICGDTGKGVFKNLVKYDVYIDLKTISELYTIEVHDTYLLVGSTVSLNGLIDVLTANADKSVSFQPLADHLKKVANIPVRNIGSWAGNLMLTHDQDNFPSDVFTIMEAAGATVTVATVTGIGEYPLWDFLSLTMTNSVIVSIQIPYCSKDTVFSTFKIMPRSQNAHAYVNAAFCMEVNSSDYTVKSIPSFVYGGIKEKAISASATESFILGKVITDVKTLQGALQTLSNEIVPNSPPVAASAKYRKDLALNLFYKFYLRALGDKVNSIYKSAATPYIRPVSQGTQSYSTDASQYPVTQPIPKLTAILQSSGEAEYTTDIPQRLGELAAAYVLTTQGNAKITSIDVSSAMDVSGAVQVITAKDIPQNGKNDFISPLAGDPELVFATDVSEYAGQAVGLAIADTPEHAAQMAQAVTIQYQSLGKQILSIQDAIAAGSFYPQQPGTTIGDADTAIKSSDHVVQGEISCGTQYHFTLETQTAFVVPEDDGGYTVYCSNQWAQLGQLAVANILGIPNNKITVIIKRVGGAYGSKLTRASHTAAACALGSYITQRPVRLHMDLESNMKMVGKRFPYYVKYTVGCTKDGVLNGVKADIYTDSGSNDNDNSISMSMMTIDNTYKCSNWALTQTSCKTHTPCNTAARAPGYLPGIFMIESIMDNVARSIGMDVEQFKQVNFYKKGDVSIISNPPKGLPLTYCNIGDLWQQLYTSADVQNRKNQISDFNKANRWRKRGISLVPLRYALQWEGANATILVSVFMADGTVSVVIGGVEIGQGINTKVAQVAASTLGISMDLITVVPTSSFTNPNGSTTGGSTTSEINCLGVLKACQNLKARIDKVKEGITDPTWLQMVQKAFANGVDLSEKYYVYGESPYPFAYNAYGVTCAEVEVDVLTGQIEIPRVDILYDCGQSINPEIDVGQVEGAFIMGLGYWLFERVIYDSNSGQLLTHNTWEYKPPTTKDIPIDFRVELLKNAPNPVGILRSKAVGEPPLCMSSAVLYAAKRAIESARHDVGNDQPFELSAPATVENIQQACLVDISKFVF